MFLFALLLSKNKNILKTDFSLLINQKSFLTQFEKILIFVLFVKKKSKHWSKTIFNKTNIQFKKNFCIRKSNLCYNYYIVLKNVFVKKIRLFYEIFTISINKKKLYRNNFLFKLKFYY